MLSIIICIRYLKNAIFCRSSIKVATYVSIYNVLGIEKFRKSDIGEKLTTRCEYAHTQVNVAMVSFNAWTADMRFPYPRARAFQHYRGRESPRISERAQRYRLPSKVLTQRVCVCVCMCRVILTGRINRILEKELSMLHILNICTSY